jgi:hypothetical protein
VYKLTGLEAFLWSWPTLHRRISLNDDPVPFDLIIETLQHFSESGADFMQHVYGYYGREGLFAGSYPWSETPIHFGPGCQGEQRTFGSFRQVVVEWSILGALTYAVKTLHRDDYFRRRLEEFLGTIKKDTRSFNPRIIAIRTPYNPDQDGKGCGGWMEKAKRVSGKDEELLMNNISQWISQKDEDNATKMEKLDDEFNQIVSSILDDEDLPEGIFEYLRELGVVDAWPRFLAGELQEMRFRVRRDKDVNWELPDGAIYPPVKFVDQLK